LLGRVNRFFTGIIMHHSSVTAVSGFEHRVAPGGVSKPAPAGLKAEPMQHP